LYPSTYQRIESMLDILKNDCSAIILDINSPGGLIAGLFDLTDLIYLIRQKTPVYTIVGESCHSAAYCLASASTKIYLARSAGVGSVGVVAVHVDQSGLHDKIGLKMTPVFAGSKKLDGSPLGPLSERAMADLQKSIDDSYTTLCQTVGRNRGILAASVKQTEAGIYYGQDAIKAGLVDTIASRSDAFKYIAQGFIKIAEFKAKLETEDQAFYDSLVDLQQDALSGFSVQGKIKSVRANLENTQSQLDACSKGQEEIKARIGELIPGEAEARIHTLEGDYKTLKGEEAVLYEDFLKACATAIALREKIKGKAYTFTSTNEMKEAAPSLDIQAYHRMEHEDTQFLIDEVEKARRDVGDSVPMKTRLGSVIDEMNKLKDMLVDYEPDIQTDKAIAAYR